MCLALCMGCSLCNTPVCASEPRVKWNVAGTTEGLWNISGGKAGWCNLLEASVETRLWKGARLETAAISTYNLNLPVADDLQAFSNIDAGPDKAFRLIQAGIRQDFTPWLTGFAGLRNMDVDHFTTPFTGLFTNASHGNFPILSSNFPLATYPLAALCLHAEVRFTENLTLRESVYNGVASDRLDRQFRFCPPATACSTLPVSTTMSERKKNIMVSTLSDMPADPPRQTMQTERPSTMRCGDWWNSPSCTSGKTIWEPCSKVALRRPDGATAATIGEPASS